MSPTLDYASPRTREPWGPLLFKPSRRSLLLLLLTITAATWLGLRHHPWRRVATIPADYRTDQLFTADNQLLTFDTHHGVNLHDPATGQHLRTVLPKIDAGTYRYFPLQQGRQILALPFTDRIALLYDVSSGRVIEKLPNPDVLGSSLVTVAPDAPKIITRRTAQNHPPLPKRSDDSGLQLWDLARTPPTTQPATAFPYSASISFSPDGQRILREAPNGDTVSLYDATTLRQLLTRTDSLRVHGVGFARTDYLWIITAQKIPSDRLVEILSSRTGQLLNSAVFTSAFTPVAFQLSDDATNLAVLSSTMVPVSGSVGIIKVHDLSTGRAFESRVSLAQWPVTFFPASHRLLAGDASTPRLAVIDPAHAQPLAVLPATESASAASAPIISPDGQTIVTAADDKGASIALYRRTGPDCPESPLGALAFPHLWLTAAAFAALACSLFADARRARPPTARYQPSAFVQFTLTLTALPLTLRLLLAACLGRLVWTPAPLLLLAALGLILRTRAWRLFTLLLVAATLPLCLFAAHALSKPGLNSATRYAPLDRYYDLPNLVPVTALCATSAFLALALYLQARPRPTD